MKQIEKEINEKNKKLKEVNETLCATYINLLETFSYYLTRFNDLERKYYDIIQQIRR